MGESQSSEEVIFRSFLLWGCRQHAKHCMRDANAKLQTIAEECGFGDASQLSKIFKHHLGISVSQFRQEHRL